MVIVPANIAEVEKKHQRPTEDQKRAMEDCDNQIQAIKHENLASKVRQDDYQTTQLQRFQNQMYDLINNSHSPHANYPGKNNNVISIEENTFACFRHISDLGLIINVSFCDLFPVTKTMLRSIDW